MLNQRETETDAVDLFAGCGGFTESAEEAEIEVGWAANHNEMAVEYHAANYPRAIHVCQDLEQANFHDTPSHWLLLASPACQGNSKASTRGGTGKRGSAPKHDADRATAWAVITCAEVHRPELVIVENVIQICDWVLFAAWCQAWEALGYQIHKVVLDAADFGVPQNRIRVFLVMSRTPLPSLYNMIDAHRVAHVGASSFVDVEGGDGWESVWSKPSGVRARIAKARRKIPKGPFLTQHTTGHPGRSLARPIGTITTKHQWAIVKRSRHGDVMRMLNGREHALAQTFRPDFMIPDEVSHAVRLVGNAVPPKLGSVVIRSVLEASGRVLVPGEGWKYVAA